jgi:hypothetical protein
MFSSCLGLFSISTKLQSVSNTKKSARSFRKRLRGFFKASGFKIRQIFFGAERSGGAVLGKISGAERSGGAASALLRTFCNLPIIFTKDRSKFQILVKKNGL